MPPPPNQPPIAIIQREGIFGVSSGELVAFYGSESYDPDGTITNYQWDFGDGQTMEALGRPISVEHCFRGAQDHYKIYTITLMVEDNDGDTDFDVETITVHPLEKTLEVTHKPTIPLPDQQVLARIDITYNWIYGETYMISQIRYESAGFFGVGEIAIWDEYSLALIWWDDILQTGRHVVQRTFNPKLSRIEHGGDIFEGIKVYAWDGIYVRITGIAGVGFGTDTPLTVAKMLFNKKNSTSFDPNYAETPELPIIVPDLDFSHYCSPGELRVYDSQGRVTGLINGEVINEIPNSIYTNDTVMIFPSSDLYRYEVVGTEDGLYGLVIASIKDEKCNNFTAVDIPFSVSVTHQYWVDWDALSQGEEGITVKVDSDADGIFELSLSSDSELTSDEYAANTHLAIDLNGDGTVNIHDLFLLAKAFQSKPGDERWDPRADLDGNDLINIADLYTVARYYSKMV